MLYWQICLDLLILEKRYTWSSPFENNHKLSLSIRRTENKTSKKPGVKKVKHMELLIYNFEHKAWVLKACVLPVSLFSFSLSHFYPNNSGRNIIRPPQVTGKMARLLVPLYFHSVTRSSKKSLVSPVKLPWGNPEVRNTKQKAPVGQQTYVLTVTNCQMVPIRIMAQRTSVWSKIIEAIRKQRKHSRNDGWKKMRT